jgi:hypothetical protein
MITQDSAKFWFPKLVAHPWKWMRDWLPSTVLIDYDEEALAESLLGRHTAEYDRLYYAVEAALRTEVLYPAFIRTDLTSAKHSGRSAYIVDGSDEGGLNYALLTTLSHAQLKSYHSKIKSSAIMVRSLIKVKHDRTAFNGLPIGNEWRVFVDKHDVQCFHKYWPDEALQDHMDDNKPATDTSSDWWAWCRTDLLDAAKEAGKAMGGGKWSVDFTEDVNGKFWLIDMATAMNSYHRPDCKFSGLEEKA